jgi:hypothetical protein
VSPLLQQYGIEQIKNKSKRTEERLESIDILVFFFVLVSGSHVLQEKNLIFQLAMPPFSLNRNPQSA